MKVFIILSVIALASAGTIDQSLVVKAKAGINVDATLVLPSVNKQALATPSLASLSGDAKVNAMVSIMESLTQAAQAPYMAVLEKLGVANKAQQFWITNKISLTNIDNSVLEALLAIDGDFHIRVPITVSINPSIHSVDNSSVVPKQGLQWGVEKIGCNAAWQKTKGEGVVVGIMDTGANVAHTALKNNYAGAWRDPYYNNAGPTDTHGHGSHALGSICGDANGVGVAPKATWVACRGLNNQGSGTEAALSTCAQWFSATANPRPHVVSNSWGGGSGDSFYDDEISTWRAANIIPVFALGNSGPSCRTANSPGDRERVIAVGATTNTDAMASFSSRGATTDGRMKPEVSAPGQNIVSCGTGANNYATMSGTSMATPHVAGAVALILSANPNYTFDQVLNALTSSADKPTLSNADRNCGVSENGDFPNNAFGAGRINVGKALGF